MLVIFFVIFLIILSALFFSGLQKKGTSPDKAKKHYIVFVCTMLGLQSALRDLSVGSDTRAYEAMFNAVYFESWDSVFNKIINYYFDGNSLGVKDPCYELLEKSFQLTGLDYRAFLFFVAIVFFTAFGYFLYKNLYHVSDACMVFIIYMLLFYGFFSVTGIRQTLAASMCLWAFEFAKRQKLLPFILLVLIGSTLHKSALLFLPAYFLIYFRYPKQILVASLVSLPILFVLRNQLVTFAAEWIGYESYAKGFEGAGAYGYASLAIIASLLILWQSTYIINSNKYASGYISLFAISVMVIPALWVDPSIMRVVQYYSIFILVLFPLVLTALDMDIIKQRHSIQKHSVQAGNCGIAYFLCMFFLLLYCVIRFAGYEYSFFFMG